MITLALALALLLGAPVHHLFIYTVIGDVLWIATRRKNNNDY